VAETLSKEVLTPPGQEVKVVSTEQVRFFKYEATEWEWPEPYMHMVQTYTTLSAGKLPYGHARVFVRPALRILLTTLSDLDNSVF